MKCHLDIHCMDPTLKTHRKSHSSPSVQYMEYNGNMFHSSSGNSNFGKSTVYEADSKVFAGVYA